MTRAPPPLPFLPTRPLILRPHKDGVTTTHTTYTLKTPSVSLWFVIFDSSLSFSFLPTAFRISVRIYCLISRATHIPSLSLSLLSLSPLRHSSLEHVSSNNDAATSPSQQCFSDCGAFLAPLLPFCGPLAGWCCALGQRASAWGRNASSRSSSPLSSYVLSTLRGTKTLLEGGVCSAR